MGLNALPTTGLVYVDAQILIYTVEKHPTYFPILQNLWIAVDAGSIAVTTSELTILEVRVAPLRISNHQLVRRYDEFLSKLQLVGIDKLILGEAANIRAGSKSFKTPDAIHLATARLAQVSGIVTNDRAFRSVLDLPVTILDEVV